MYYFLEYFWHSEDALLYWPMHCKFKFSFFYVYKFFIDFIELNIFLGSPPFLSFPLQPSPMVPTWMQGLWRMPESWHCERQGKAGWRCGLSCSRIRELKASWREVEIAQNMAGSESLKRAKEKLLIKRQLQRKSQHFEMSVFSDDDQWQLQMRNGFGLRLHGKLDVLWEEELDRSCPNPWEARRLWVPELGHRDWHSSTLGLLCFDCADPLDLFSWSENAFSVRCDDRSPRLRDFGCFTDDLNFERAEWFKGAEL